MAHAPTARMRGFTLIELMIVIVIIGTLASIAIYAYQEYIIRSQVAEGVTLSTAPQLALVEYASTHSGFPADNNAAGLPPPSAIAGNYVSSVTTTNGIIDVVFGPQANGAIAGTTKQCVLSPITSAPGVIRWQATCGFDSRYLPPAWR